MSLVYACSIFAILIRLASMKTFISSCFLAIGILFFATAGQTSAQNLIINGDFETGDFTGWTVTHAPSGSNIFVDHGPGPDTTFGAFFGATGSDFDRISQAFATTPGAFYTLTFFYQITNINMPMPPFNNGFDVLWNGVSIGGGLFPQFDVQPGFGTFTFHLQAAGALTTLEFDGRSAHSFDFLDDVSVTASCVRGQGYWKNHSDQWPVTQLLLGNNTYDQAELLSILQQPVRGNGLVLLAHQLIAAKLNIASGADGSCIQQTIADADALIGNLVVPPVGNGSLRPGDASALADTLEDYNQGGLCSPSCDL